MINYSVISVISVIFRGKTSASASRCAMRFIVDILWYKYRVKVFHDFSGKLMGQNAVNTSCRQQLGSSSLPLSGLLDVFCNSPKIFRHSFQSLFFCGFFLVQQPNAVFLMQIQRSPVQITPGQDNVSILARSLALHNPCGVRAPIKPLEPEIWSKGSDAACLRR